MCEIRFDSDVEILSYYDYDIYSHRNRIRKDDLDDIMRFCGDIKLYEFYENHPYPFDDEFYKKLDEMFKKQVKNGANEYAHAMYLVFFSLMRLKYGKQTEIDIRVSKYLLYSIGWHCRMDYHEYIPLTYPIKLFEIAKRDVSKHFKIPMDVLPKEIPDDWTIDRFNRWDWVNQFVESCLNDEKKIKYFYLCGCYAFYYFDHWLDRKLPEIKFNF